MTEEERKQLESLGWRSEFLEYLHEPPSFDAVDQMFLDRALAALQAASCSALELLAKHPGVSLVHITQQLAHEAKQRVSAMGLIIAIYQEAMNNRMVRQIAKDLLARQIHENYASGWSVQGKVHPLVQLGLWETHIKKYVRDPAIPRYASSIMRHLAIEHPPTEGWQIQLPNDPLMDELFDRYWPKDEENRCPSGEPA